MPFHFNTQKDNSKYTGYKSVLIVPCRFCPAASFSVTNHEPYIDLFRKFLATESYERYIEYLRSELEKEGIKFDNRFRLFAMALSGPAFYNFIL